MHRWVFVAVVVACGGVVMEPQDRSITDVQSACVDDDTVRVQMMGCLSSSCDTLLSASCTAELRGGVVEVTGAAVVRREGTECTDDCGFIVAECDLPAGVDPEEDILVFGGDDGGPLIRDAGCDEWLR